MTCNVANVITGAAYQIVERTVGRALLTFVSLNIKRAQRLISLAPPGVARWRLLILT
jgi:hypothetical protein